MSNHSFAVIDLETTGFSNSDRIIEVGVVLADAAGRVEKRWRTLVQPDRGFDNGFVHGITPSDLIEAPRFEDIALRLADLLNGRVVVAHNASFEKRFLGNEFARIGLPLPDDGDWLLDTMRSAKGILPGPSYKLEACLECIDVDNAAAHTALADADATACLLAYLLPWMTDDLSGARPLHLDDFDLAVLPPSTVPLLVRDDGLFTDEEDGTSITRSTSTGEHADSGEWMRRITDAAPGIGDRAADEYMGLLADAMVDDRLDDDEIAQLLDTAHALELSDDDVDELHELYLRQVSIEAWADGVVTAEERERLLTIADELSIGRARVAVWLAEPLGSWTTVRRQAEASDADDDGNDAESLQLVLAPGDRVTFTGAMAIPREEWARRATEAGLDVGGVCGRSRVVVAADVASMSGKAKKARELGVPVIGEREFAKLLHNMVDDAAPVDGAPTEAAVEAAASPYAEDTAVPVVDAVPEIVHEAAVLDLGRIFPWLADVPETQADAAGVVESWLTFRADLPLHSMSPVLEPATRPEGVDLTLKTTATWFEVYPEPLVASAEDLRELRHVGRVKLRSFVYATVLQAIDDAELLDGDGGVSEGLGAELYDETASDEAPDFFDGGFPTSDDFYSDSAARAVGPLDADEIVAGWVALLGDWPSATGTDAEDDALGAPPALVREALDEAADPTDRVVNRAVAEIDEAIGIGDLRRAAIVQGRVAGTRTLDDVGQEFGVTRERIRQIEKKVLEDLSMAGPACDLINAALPLRFGPCIPESDLLGALPGIGAEPSAARMRLLDVLPATAAESPVGWRIDEGWFLVGDIDGAILAAIDAHADDYGTACVGEVAADVGIDPEILELRLRETTAFEFRDGRVFTRVASIPERAATELHLANRPMTTEELHRALGNRSITSISNALSLADEIIRCGRGTWALAEWGEEEWTTIFDLINRRIDESEDGFVSIEDLNADADRFGVSRNSILTYASTPEFVIEDRRVRRAGEDEKPTVRATPEESRAFYRRNGNWCLLVTVTRDHLRGSGSQIPVGVAVHCGLEFGETIHMPSRLGEQRVSWGRSMTSIGTISRFMADLGCVEGDRVWLVFGDEFDVVPATPRLSGLDGAAELLNATGMDDFCDADSTADVDAVLAVVNEALDLSAGAARRKTVSRLRHRRDEELAELVRGL
ncbi:exonuclease domain-containing protein [Corynebacterium sp. NPDC060344]|uniref:exonuclease domain-containing protein n=1 Tax=Corynebacterium sp. NPDC060344 TaxID=3347101 RepID=UPI0036693D25